MKTNHIAPALAFGVFFSFSTAAAPVSQAAEVFPGAWTAAAGPGLNATADLQKKAATLLRRVVPDLADFPLEVGEAVFADIDGDGRPELAATVDFSGRGFFNNLFVVKQVGDRYQWSDLQGKGYSIDGLKSRLVDLDGDGRKEFVMKDFIDRYEGAIRVPTQVLVYGWKKDRFVDASGSFASYYRDRVVPALEQQVEAIDASSTATSAKAADRYDDDVLRAELARAKQQARQK